MCRLCKKKSHYFLNKKLTLKSDLSKLLNSIWENVITAFEHLPSSHYLTVTPEVQSMHWMNQAWFRNIITYFTLEILDIYLRFNYNIYMSLFSFFVVVFLPIFTLAAHVIRSSTAGNRDLLLLILFTLTSWTQTRPTNHEIHQTHPHLIAQVWGFSIPDSADLRESGII